MFQIVKVPIVRIDKKTGEIKEYIYQSEAVKEGFNTSSITHCCKHHQFVHYGYFWVYKRDYNEKTYENCLKLNKPKGNFGKKFVEYKICTKCQNKKHYTEFHSCARGLSGTRADCKDCNNKRSSKGRKTLEKTPQRRISWNLRRRVYIALKRKLKNKHKSRSAITDLGCSIDDLRFWLEFWFDEGMSWDNYSSSGWHIDHIIPLCNFDLTDRDQFLKACHYTNLQPLWASDNLKKPKKLR